MSAFRSAAENADWTGTPGFGVILTDQQGRDAWPIAGATFILYAQTAARSGGGRGNAHVSSALAYANGAKTAEESSTTSRSAAICFRGGEGDVGATSRMIVRRCCRRRVESTDAILGNAIDATRNKPATPRFKALRSRQRSPGSVVRRADRRARASGLPRLSDIRPRLPDRRRLGSGYRKIRRAGGGLIGTLVASLTDRDSIAVPLGLCHRVIPQ